MSDVKKDKKSKKEKKEKRKRQEEDAEQQQEQVPAVQAEEPEKEKKKKSKKSKKQKVEEEQADASPASTSAALNDLAEEVRATQSEPADEEVFDLSSLKKSAGRTTKVAMHSSRANVDDAAREEAAAFKPDDNAEVKLEQVRIFLGNLPFKITDELVHECFDEFGEIEGIHWVTDKATGRFYGTAFVDFTTPEAAQAALVRNGVEILGREVKVNFATGANVASAKRFNSKEKKGAHLAKLPISEKPDGCNTVFLGNLSFQIDEETIREVFKDCGEITDVRWVEKDGEFKGCGFVEFADTHSTDEAVKWNGEEVLGRPMRVDYSARGSR